MLSFLGGGGQTRKSRFLIGAGTDIINIFLDGPFPASFSLFSYFYYSSQYTNILYESLPMAGFEPRTSGVGSNHSSN